MIYVEAKQWERVTARSARKGMKWQWGAMEGALCCGWVNESHIALDHGCATPVLGGRALRYSRCVPENRDSAH